MKYSKVMVFVYTVLAAMLISACGSQQVRHKSSVVDYLYPNSSDLRIEPSIPMLNIPINVGIAFVPSQSSVARGSSYWTGITNDSVTVSETKKTDLLESISDHFKRYDFVRTIEVIPSQYLQPGGSFANLGQIKTMYGIDVIALVSYDQIQFTDEDTLALTYWTLVGAYIFKGEKNDTSTLMDTVVYDIASKKMLFRAPGTSLIKGSSTPVNLSEELREDSIKGFEVATEEMVANLDEQLNNFREKIKDRPEDVQLTYSPEYKGGSGSLAYLDLLLMLAVPALFTTRKIMQKDSRHSVTGHVTGSGL